MAGGVEYQVTQVDPTDPTTKGMVYQVHAVTEEVAATLGGKTYRARIVNDPSSPLVAGKVYQIVLIDDPEDPSVKGKVYNAIVTGLGPVPEVVVVGPGVAPLSLPDALAEQIDSLIAFGGTEQRNIPDNYLQRQFIYMMDNSYLVPDITPEPDWHIEMDFQTTSVSTAGVRDYFGGRYDSSSAGAGIRLSHTSSKKVVLYGFDTNNAYTGPSYNMADNTRYKYVYNNGSASLSTGGTVVDSTTFTPNDTTTSAVGINSYRGPSGSYSSTTEGIYLYSFKMWNGQGELVMDLVPAVQKGTVPVVGFYDTVSGTFKTATSGTFAAGGEAVPTPDAPMDIVCNNGVLKARHQSGLPWDYTLLDYIESTGTQYIDTGYKPNQDTKVEVDFEFNTSLASNVVFFGATSFWVNASFGLYIGSGGTVFSNYNSDTDISSEFSPVLNTRYLYTHDKRNIYIDGVLKYTHTAATFQSTGNMFLGRVEGTGSFKSKGKYYSVKIWDNGTLVRDFVPARRSPDGVLGMYDLANGHFYTNAGTGDFVAGSTVSDPVEVYADGLQETIGIRTRNLFNIATATSSMGINASTGEESSQSNVVSASDYIIVSGGEKYTLNTQSWSTQTSGIAWYNANKEYISGQTYTGLAAQTFTAPANAYYARITARTDQNPFQFEQGTAATNYIPYNDSTAVAEMLLKIGDIADQQEIIDGAVTRNVGVKVLDGTEDWQGDDGDSSYYIYIPQLVGATSRVGLSNYFECTNTSSGQQGKFHFGGASVNGNVIFSVGNTWTTKNAWKQWLADKYNAGTPVIVIYPLATETTETVTAQPMSTTEGDNIVEITQASMSGLELQVSYVKEG